MKKTAICIIVSLLVSCLYASEEEMWTMTNDTAFYNSVTKSAEFNYKMAYNPVSFSSHDMFQDIKVSAVESVPFAFLYTFAGLWIYKAINGRTFSPSLGNINDPENKGVFIATVSTFAAINVFFNVTGYYNYDKKNGSKPSEEIKHNP
jgi:hypothetical protein